MQTLGLSDSSPGTENRLKALLWPSVNTASDLDYLGTQGYWICTLVAVASFVFSMVWGNALSGLLVFLFYYFGGVGVREHNRYAATAMAIIYSIDTILVSIGVVRIILAALLIANMRATWIASNWNPSSDEAVAPPRLNETFADKLADQWPMWVWPKMRILYYIYSAGFIGLMFYGWSHLPLS